MMGFSSTAISQTVPERRDTAWGVAIVLDTINAAVVTVVWPSYTVTVSEFSMTDWMKNVFPRITDVRYFRTETCEEIPFKRLITFKQL